MRAFVLLRETVKYNRTGEVGFPLPELVALLAYNDEAEALKDLQYYDIPVAEATAEIPHKLVLFRGAQGDKQRDPASLQPRAGGAARSPRERERATTPEKYFDLALRWATARRAACVASSPSRSTR